jgi:hypothetical protein
VLQAAHELVDGVAPEGELLHVQRVLPDVLYHRVRSLLEDVDDVRRLDLALGLSLLLLRPSHRLQLTRADATLGTRHRRTNAATRIISQLLLYVVGEGKGTEGGRHPFAEWMDDQMLMALSLPCRATAAS